MNSATRQFILLMQENYKAVFVLTAATLLLSGCVSASPVFDCDDIRVRAESELEAARKSAGDYYVARGQKDGKYYGVRIARSATCIGTLGLLCGVADEVASDNKRIEIATEEAQGIYEKSASVAKGLIREMERHGCADIPPGLDKG